MPNRGWLDEGNLWAPLAEMFPEWGRPWLPWLVVFLLEILVFTVLITLAQGRPVTLWNVNSAFLIASLATSSLLRGLKHGRYPRASLIATLEGFAAGGLLFTNLGHYQRHGAVVLDIFALLVTWTLLPFWSHRNRA